MLLLTSTRKYQKHNSTDKKIHTPYKILILSTHSPKINTQSTAADTCLLSAILLKGEANTNVNASPIISVFINKLFKLFEMLSFLL